MTPTSDSGDGESPRKRAAQPRRKTAAQGEQGAASKAAHEAAAAGRKAPRKAPAQAPRVPPQGYDPQGTDPIMPPSRGELLRAAVGATGELARVGRDAGWRLLVDAFKRARG